ncbi:hypothetical protein JXA05_03565 [Candidatus Peregrinibacteria bacterium]|nr:hypothetical protein [Candidatus Peregrinibacteria bacterium]
MDKNRLNLINVITSATLIFLIGLFSGYGTGYFHAIRKSFPEIRPIDDVNPGIATVKLMEVKNGYLVGRISGKKTRLAYRPDGIMDMEPEQEFKIPVGQISLKDYYAAENVPQDAQFIASSNGKYYYSILSKKAWSISPANRVFFKSSREAETAGYLKN